METRLVVNQNVNPNEHFKHFSNHEAGTDVDNLMVKLFTTSSIFLVQPSILSINKGYIEEIKVEDPSKT